MKAIISNANPNKTDVTFDLDEEFINTPEDKEYARGELKEAFSKIMGCSTSVSFEDELHQLAVQ